MPPSLAITGLGINVSTASDIRSFEAALVAGRARFDYLKRPGREGAQKFPGAEIDDAEFEASVAGKAGLLRTASFSSQVAAATLAQAWSDARLDSRQVAPERVGLIVGGSNFQQRHQEQTMRRYQSSPQLIRPTYALSFWDTDMVGVLSECFQIRGDACTVGGASAGGALALIHAARQLQLGLADVSIVIGPLFDISFWECQALTSLGAMGSSRFAEQPWLACRPFDAAHDGFIYGEGCAAIVLERIEHARQSDAKAYGRLCGWSMVLDGARNPKPDAKGQQAAMRAALEMAQLKPEQVDYVNPHGTGSPLGDETELEALRAIGLSHCWINATKSLTGHCLTASGAIEVIATLLQLRGGFCHPTRNLIEPIDSSFRWVSEAAVEAELHYAISNSFAFGGVSTSIVLAREA